MSRSHSPACLLRAFVVHTLLLGLAGACGEGTIDRGGRGGGGCTGGIGGTGAIGGMGGIGGTPCASAPPGTRVDASTYSWENGLAGTVSELIRLRRDQSLAVMFHTGAIPAFGEFSSVPPVSQVAPSGARYLTLSRCPGDFSVSTASCYVQGTAGAANIRFRVGDGSAVRPGECPLEPGTDYYLNVTHAMADPRGQFENFRPTCAEGNTCGFYLQFGISEGP